MIYWIDGQFWSWKTSFAVSIMNAVAKWNMIFTNIKVNTNKIPNVYEFWNSFKDIMTVFRTINLINDLERYCFNVPIKWSILPYYPRKAFTKFYIFWDEAPSAVTNKENLENVYQEYVDQNRKNFMDFYLIGADWSWNNKGFRKYVEWWYYSKPFTGFPILRDIRVIRRQQREQDWYKLKMEEYTWFDFQWDLVNKTRPIDNYYTWYYQPSVRTLYDDLHKNIKDPKKYIDINYNWLTSILNTNKYLRKALVNKPEFKEVITNFWEEHKKLLSVFNWDPIEFDDHWNPIFDFQDKYTDWQFIDWVNIDIFNSKFE